MLNRSFVLSGVFAVLLSALCLPACIAGDGSEFDDTEAAADEVVGQSEAELKDDGLTDRCALFCLEQHVDCIANGGSQAKCDREESYCHCKQCDLFRKEPEVCKGIFSAPVSPPTVVSPGVRLR